LRRHDHDQERYAAYSSGRDIAGGLHGTAGLSATALAHALGVTPARINDIVRERRGITADTALRLARYFGTDAQSWINLQTAYDLRVTELAAGEAIHRIVKPRRAA